MPVAANRPELAATEQSAEPAELADVADVAPISTALAISTSTGVADNAAVAATRASVAATAIVETPQAADSPESEPEPRRRNRVARAAWYSTVAVLAAFLVVAAIWTVTGGRSFVVSTPSMSPKVPVGSLVLTRPVPPGGPKVGQIIAFHPPSEPKTTYTHRVVKVMPGPTYLTKGDLDSSPDAWVVMPKNIIGVATHHYRGIGWLVRALPWLALGAVVLMGIAAFTPRNRRRITYFVGGTIVVSIPILILRPLVRGVFAGSGLFGGRVHALVVNTGLLPLRFKMKGAVTQHTAAGYPAHLSAKPPASGHLLITGTVDLSLLGWILLVLICLAPLLIALTVPPKYWDGEEETDSAPELAAGPEPVALPA